MSQNEPQFEVLFLDSGREPQCAPDPAYPKGMDVVLTRNTKIRCVVAVPYPAPRCGMWHIKCNKCGVVVGVTTAGRVDDPRSVHIRCQLS